MRTTTNWVTVIAGLVMTIAPAGAQEQFWYVPHVDDAKTPVEVQLESPDLAMPGFGIGSTKAAIIKRIEFSLDHKWLPQNQVDQLCNDLKKISDKEQNLRDADGKLSYDNRAMIAKQLLDLNQKFEEQVLVREQSNPGIEGLQAREAMMIQRVNMAGRRERKSKKSAQTGVVLSTAVLLALGGQTAALADDSSSSSSGSSGSSDSSGSSSSKGSDSLISPLFPSSSGGDSGSSSSSSTTTTSAPTTTSSPSTSSDSGSSGAQQFKEGEKDLTPVNPLKGLFQMQPQYPSPGKTQMFPEAVSPNMGKDSDVQGRSPGQASHTFQQNFSDPYATPEEKNNSTVNPIKGLFQQQPQYPSPGKTEKFPEAVPQHLGNDSDVPGRSPGQAGAAFQNEWKDPYAPTELPSKDKENYLKGLFQQQPTYPSPNKTVMYPEAVQKNLGNDSEVPGRHPGSVGTPYTPPEPQLSDSGSGSGTSDKDKGAGLPASSLPGAQKEGEKKEGEKTAEGEKKEGEKKEGDKTAEGEKKEGEKKEGDKKDEKTAEGDKKDSDKKDDKTASTDKKDGDKKDDKAAAGDKKDTDKKADADKKDGDKKDDKTADASKDDKKDGDKKKDEEKVVYAPYNPLREAISLMNTGKFAECVDLLSREIKKAANNPQAYYTRAVAYVRMRQYDQAASDYKQVLKLTPTGPIADRAKTGLTKLHF